MCYNQKFNNPSYHAVLNAVDYKRFEPGWIQRTAREFTKKAISYLNSDQWLASANDK